MAQEGSTTPTKEGKVMYTCSVCGKEFETQAEHDKHHSEAHGGEQVSKI